MLIYKKNDEIKMTREKYSFDYFVKYGPLIATFIIVIIFHSMFFYKDPVKFLNGLVTPSILLQMFGFLIAAIITGYIIDVIPTFITGQFFFNFFGQTYQPASLRRVIFYGFHVAMI